MKGSHKFKRISKTFRQKASEEQSSLDNSTFCPFDLSKLQEIAAANHRSIFYLYS